MIVLQPQGSLDLQGGNLFKEQIASLTPQPHDLWVIDLAQVDIVDSSGLVALVTGLSAIRQSGCRLLLCNVQPPVRIVFELSQLDKVFEIFESYDAAMTTIEAVAKNATSACLAK